HDIYPTESRLFSVPPKRNGVKAPLAQALGLPVAYYQGNGDDIVVLVDNVRDDNFKDLNNTQGFSYIAGFFSSGVNGLFNRNVMTIDAFDWLHRTTENPPNEPVAGDNCTSAPARPFLYEGVFAHEYQHLLRSYTDPAETTWQNEGTSDTAIVLTGYGDPTAAIGDIHFDSHIQCFQGYLGVLTDANPNPRAGGPENSLNVWGDQSDDHESEILCDYGAAYSFLLWLADTFGDEVLTRLHNDAAHQGFAAVQAVLDDLAPGMTVSQAIDAWQATMALDGVIDDGGTLSGGDADLYQVDRLNASINWDTDDAYDTPGAPPNGGDFVRLRDGSSAYLSADQITDITFDGVADLPPLPITWVVDPDPPTHTGDPALYSTDADGRNDVIVQDVTMGSELTFEAMWDLETTFDFAYVQVTTDGGETYTSLACTDTVDDTDPDLGNVGPGFGPGFNGFHGGAGQPPLAFAPQTCDTSAYSGQTVGLAFRYFSDSNTHGAGFWVDDVAIDGSVISDGSTLTGWRSATEYNPVEVEGYTVQLVAYPSAGGEAHLFTLPLDPDFHGELSGADIAAAIGSSADVVSAIVTYHDGTELVTQYAPYTLTVNGVLQPGGS
ncbi:MAG: peptidase M6, partial [Candidatus Velamenicoccus archaeovorus]